MGCGAGHGVGRNGLRPPRSVVGKKRLIHHAHVNNSSSSRTSSCSAFFAQLSTNDSQLFRLSPPLGRVRSFTRLLITSGKLLTSYFLLCSCPQSDTFG